MINRIFAAGAAAALLASPLAAQDNGLVAGATVLGPQGNPVGTVDKVENGTVSLNTGKHVAALPTTAFGTSEAGPTITVTKDQLNAMIDGQMAEVNAKRDAALVAGATVVTRGGVTLGVVESVEGDNVVVAREDGPFALVRDNFTMQGDALAVIFTEAQIEEALAAQASATAAPEAASEDAAE